MFDSFNRHINYLRISVTDRCNLRCTYCMPEQGVRLMEHADILSFEEIVDVVKVAVDTGVNKVRITGGEPLVRKGVVDLVKMLAAVPGIRDLSMTTNGQLLEKYALPLREAGLQRVNISLDTMDAGRYAAITRGGDIRHVLRGLEAAESAGLLPIKVNCVIKKSADEPDAVAVAEYCTTNRYQVRFIREMDLDNGEFYVVHGGSGGDCSSCNRLRLTANGMVKPCLFDDLEYSVRELGAREAILRALENKPACGTFSNKREFYNTGG